jgi:hypothetical protein
MDVLARIEPPYVDAYMSLAQEYDYVTFHEQGDFKSDMGNLIHEDAEFICFLCDDVVAIDPINLDDVESLMTDKRIIGTSLRLGSNVWIGMFGNDQHQPVFEPAGPDSRFLAWDMDDAVGDWAYPWDVLGTFYRADFVKALWPSIALAQNPSMFEDGGSKMWRLVTQQHHYASWSTARTIIPTINVVQDQFANGVIGPNVIDPLLLLECYQAGLRLDTARYTEKTYPSWRIGDLFLKRTQK